MHPIVVLRSPKRTPLLILWMALALIVVGCSSIAPAPATPIPSAQVRVQLSWLHTIEWAGFYVADDKGYYTDQSLTMNLLVGGFDAQGNYIDPISTVVANNADFGVINGASLLQARAANTPVVAIAAIYQRNPLAFTSLAEKHIVKPADLVGKNVQISSGSLPIFQAMLATQKIDPKQITIVERTDSTIAPLISGQADVIDAWVTNEVVTLKLQGHALNTMLPIDYGVDEYPDVIFTTEKMIAEHPELVERFLRATVRGIQGAIDDPKSVSALVKKHDATLDPAQETEAMYQSVPLLNPPGSHPGMMTAETWDITQRTLRDQGTLKQPLDIKAAYTLEFVKKIYSK